MTPTTSSGLKMKSTIQSFRVRKVNRDAEVRSLAESYTISSISPIQVTSCYPSPVLFLYHGFMKIPCF